MKKNLFLVLLLVLILLLPSSIRAADKVVSDEAVNVNNALDALIGKEPAGEKSDENGVPVNDQEKGNKKAKKTKILVNEIGRDGRFIAYDNGTVLDTQTNLMWAANDNSSDINWADAKSYCDNYRGGGYMDWRMPTQEELAGLYDGSKSSPQVECARVGADRPIRSHVTELIQFTCMGSWGSDTRGDKVATFNIAVKENFGRQWHNPNDTYLHRVLPVRYSKTEESVANNMRTVQKTKAIATEESSIDSIKYMQNLKDSCASGNNSYACVWIGETTSSTCKRMDQCANEMVATLRVNGITFTTNDKRNPYSDMVTAYKPGCIGYRTDIGGTKEGAMALVELLGETQFYVDESSCHTAGFKYNVIRR